MSTCGICDDRVKFAVVASERMLGLGGEFRYDRCVACGCVQLRDVPADMGRYYGDGYYAFTPPTPPSPARRAYRVLRDAVLFGRARAVGSVLVPFLPTAASELREWLIGTGAHRRTRILDVGCGAGLTLRRLADEGFDAAEGVDPFVSADIVYRGRVLVRKASIHQAPGPYDVIMFHHSLEHIPDQRETMARVAELLVPGGTCLVRIPTVSSFAWEEYRDRWVQLDAPRHLYLHSVESLRTLADSAGLSVRRVVFDSTAFQFIGSELYRRDRPLSELDPGELPWRRRLGYAGRARRLNAAGRGDQAAFYLRRA